MSRADIAAQAPDKTKVTFSGGKAAGTARWNGLRSGSSNTIAMKSTQQGLFGTSPVMVAVLDCNADLPDYGFDVLVAYNADKEMVGSLMTEGSNEIGYVSARRMEKLRVVDGTVIFNGPQPRLYGDESCRTCGGSASVANSMDLDQGTIICPIALDDPSKPWMTPRPSTSNSEQKQYGSWLLLSSDMKRFRITHLQHKVN